MFLFCIVHNECFLKPFCFYAWHNERTRVSKIITRDHFLYFLNAILCDFLKDNKTITPPIPTDSS